MTEWRGVLDLLTSGGSGSPFHAETVATYKFLEKRWMENFWSPEEVYAGKPLLESR